MEAKKAGRKRGKSAKQKGHDGLPKREDREGSDEEKILLATMSALSLTARDGRAVEKGRVSRYNES